MGRGTGLAGGGGVGDGVGEEVEPSEGGSTFRPLRVVTPILAVGDLLVANSSSNSLSSSRSRRSSSFTSSRAFALPWVVTSSWSVQAG